jgi:hypothetical protein
LKQRTITVLVLALSAFVLAAAASSCGGTNAMPADRQQRAATLVDAGACENPNEGCACADDSEPVSCGVVVRREKGVVYCGLGKRACADGYYAPCDVTEVVTRDAPPGEAGSYSTMGLGSSQLCADNPCDPYCNKFVDNGSGLDAGSPLAIVDGGLTLQQGVSPSPNYNGIAITPSSQSVVITKINPNAYPTTSPAAPIKFQAYFIPSNPLAYTSALWTVSDNDDAFIQGTGDLTIVGNVPTNFAVNASANGFKAQAQVSVTVNDVEVSGNPPNFGAAPSGADSASVLYPYANTIFPRSLTAPILQWSTGGAAATYVKYCARMRTNGAMVFNWCNVLPEPNPQRGGFPSYVWKAFETAASDTAKNPAGRAAELSLQRYVNGSLRNEIVVPVKFSSEPMRGTVYFWEINNGRIARINPDGSLGQNFLQPNPNRCLACHSVSADGTNLTSQGDGGNGLGVNFDLRYNGQIWTRPASVQWQAMTPNGEWNMAYERPALLQPTRSNANNGVLYTQNMLADANWGYVDTPAWSPGNGNWVAYADRYVWNWPWYNGYTWYVDYTVSEIWESHYNTPPTQTVDGTNYLPSSTPCTAVTDLVAGPVPTVYTIPGMSCTPKNGCGATCVAGGHLDYQFNNTVGGQNYTVRIGVADYKHNCADTISINVYVDGQYLGSWSGGGGNVWAHPSFSFTAWKSQHTIQVYQANDACYGCGCPGVTDPTKCAGANVCSPWVGDLNLYIDDIQLIDQQEMQWKDGYWWDAASSQNGCSSMRSDCGPFPGSCGGSCVAGQWVAYWFPTVPGNWYTARFKVADYLHNCSNRVLTYVAAQGPSGTGWTGWQGQWMPGSWSWQYPGVTFYAHESGAWVYIQMGTDACCACSNTCNGACNPQFGDLNLYVDDVYLLKASGNQFFQPSIQVAPWHFDGTDMTNTNAYPTFTPDEAKIAWQTGNAQRTRGNWGDLWITTQNNPAANRVRMNNANAAGLAAADLHVNYEPSFSPVRSGGYDWLVFSSTRTYGNTLTPTGSQKDWGMKQLWVTAVDPTVGAPNDPSAPAFWLPGQQTSNQNMRGFFAKSPCGQTSALCEYNDDCCGYNKANPAASTAKCLINQPYTNPVTRSCQAVQAFSCVATNSACGTDTDCCNYPGELCLQGLCKSPPPPPQYVPAAWSRDYQASCPSGTNIVWQAYNWKAYTPSDSYIAFWGAIADTQAGLPAASLSPAAPAQLLTTAKAQNYTWSFYPLSSISPPNNTKQWLRTYDLLYPSSDGTQAPILTDWTVTYDCLPSQ